MDFDMNLLAYCGLYCDQCAYRVALAEGDERHLEPIPSVWREKRPTPVDYECEGCKGRNICGPCVLKDCAVPRGLNHCGECAEFPCGKLQGFGSDGAPHHHQAIENLRVIREKGVEAWFEEYRPQLQCHCEKRRSWYCGCPTHDAGAFPPVEETRAALLEMSRRKAAQNQ